MRLGSVGSDVLAADEHRRQRRNEDTCEVRFAESFTKVGREIERKDGHTARGSLGQKAQDRTGRRRHADRTTSSCRLILVVRPHPCCVQMNAFDVENSSSWLISHQFFDERSSSERVMSNVFGPPEIVQRRFDVLGEA